MVASVNSKFDPNKLYAHQTWARFAKGQTLVGVNESDTDFATAGKTGGAKTHTLTTAQIPAHTHGMNYATNWDGTKSSGWVIGTNSGSRVDKTGSTGSGAAHNNLQPYVTVYYWKRTA